MGLFLASVLNTAITIIIIAIIVRALLSFAPLDPWHPINRFLHQFTEPFLQPIRNLLPSTGMFDLSPMVAIILLSVINSILQQVLIALLP